MTFSSLIPAAIASAALLAAPQFAFSQPSIGAQSTEWAETLGARMRVHVEPIEGNSSWRAVLDVELEKGWNSYWHDPGANGIPPQVTISDVTGTKISTDLTFQAPQKLGYGEKQYAGYLDRFALGITPQIQSVVPQNIDVFLGLCSDICVPFQISFELKGPQSESAQKLSSHHVAKAFAKMPENLGTVAVAKTGDRVRFELPVLGQDGDVLFLSEREGWRFGGIKRDEVTDGTVHYSAEITKQGPLDLPVPFTLVSKNKGQSVSGTLEMMAE